MRKTIRFTCDVDLIGNDFMFSERSFEKGEEYEARVTPAHMGQHDEYDLEIDGITYVTVCEEVFEIVGE